MYGEAEDTDEGTEFFVIRLGGLRRKNGSVEALGCGRGRLRI